MADSSEIDIGALHEAIKAGIAERFSASVPTVDYYSRPGEKVPVPAIYFELESVEPGDVYDTGTEQFSCVLRFTAFCIYSYKQGNKLASRVLAANLVKLIFGNRWGCPVGAAQIIGAFPDHFDVFGQRSEDESYEVWRVDWQHEVYLGESVWNGEGELPKEVYLGITPKIGPKHIMDYFQVN